MTKQVTKKQHYAPKFYFKRFSEDTWLQVLHSKSGKILKPKPYSGVGYADFFYAENTGEQDEVSQHIEAFFQSIESIFSSHYEDIVETILEYRQLSTSQIDSLAWFFASLWVRSPKMRNQINRNMESAMKQITQHLAALPGFKDNAMIKLEGGGFDVSDKEIEGIQSILSNGDYSLNFNNQSHIKFIADCEEWHNWFGAKNWRFYIAKGSKRFITSDSPVIDIFNREGSLAETIGTNHIMQRRQFLALTPDILIELIDPRFGKKAKRKAVQDEEVLAYNLLLAQHSGEHIYSIQKSDLEDMVEFYIG